MSETIHYKKIEFTLGASLESAFEQLSQYHKNGKRVYGEFNGRLLFSDSDTLDSAYVKVTGKTKLQFDELERQRQEQYKAEKKKHEDSMPELTKEWVEKGKSILDQKHHERWERVVPIRLGDLYRGMELGATLDIVKELNAGCDLIVAKAIIDGQGHSGMSYGLVRSMVKAFCDRGDEFFKYTSPI